VQILTYRNRSSLPQAFLNRLITINTFQWRKSKKTWIISVMFTSQKLRD
jgi:hypothetical protein